MKGHPERKNPQRKGRSRQRQRALDVLYEADLRGYFRNHKLGRAQELLEQRKAVSTAQVPIKEYGIEIVQAYIDNADDVDSMIDAASPDWALNRMSAVDRTILRIAATEMMYLNLDRPIAVKEAASLAREFSADKSVPFTMGVLNRVADIRDLETSGTGFSESTVVGDDYVPVENSSSPELSSPALASSALPSESSDDERDADNSGLL